MCVCSSQERVGRQEAEINRRRITTESAAEERDRLRRQVRGHVTVTELYPAATGPCEAGSGERSGLSRSCTLPPLGRVRRGQVRGPDCHGAVPCRHWAV